ncbi:MAG: acyl-CoA thioesterase [Alphaproteobacteria bacterium]|nr:acyl-CoA thioesterase [Alphaproteobacteria bacterium SS10]
MSDIQHDFKDAPALRTIAMPADANPNGDIFGGWLLAQMDLAGSVLAIEEAKGRVATVGVQAMTFHKPVMVGDDVLCYADLVRVGNTSVTVKVTTYARNRINGHAVKVTEGDFTYVALGEDRRPRPVKQTDN